jgi:hypothetical protein
VISIIILLLLWHALADFPLQGDFLSRAKDPTGIGNVIWPWCMGAHCMIQAGGVYLITGAWQVAVFEFATHWVIDWTKCRGRISFNTDQVLHLVGKLVIVAYLVLR